MPQRRVTSRFAGTGSRDTSAMRSTSEPTCWRSPRSADQRQRACLVELVQRVLHPPRDELVALFGIAAGAAEFLAQVDRRKYLDRDLRRQGKPSREVEHGDAPRRGERSEERRGGRE